MFLCISLLYAVPSTTFIFTWAEKNFFLRR